MWGQYKGLQDARLKIMQQNAALWGQEFDQTKSGIERLLPHTTQHGLCVEMVSESLVKPARPTCNANPQACAANSWLPGK
jgi:hypothetical protein